MSIDPKNRYACLCTVIALVAALLPAFPDPAGAAILAPDTNFRPPLFARSATPGRALLLPDGKYLLFNSHETLTDRRTGPLTRYLADGTLDSTFSFSRSYRLVTAAAPGSAGKIYVAAAKGLYGQTTVTEVLRLNVDGSIDATFTPTTTEPSATVLQLLMQPDGKILVTGSFFSFAGQAQPSIVRLLSNGTIDSGFNHQVFADAIYAVALQSDGKILIGGYAFTVGVQPQLGVARLNANGSLDASFAASDFQPPSQPVRGIAVSAGGKVLLSGKFRLTSNGSYFPLLQLNTNGSRDTNFILTTNISSFSTGRDLELQPDGKIVVALDRYLYRFNSDGSVDDTFSRPVAQNNSLGIPGSVITVDLLPDGDILIGGTFTDIQGSGQPAGTNFGVARVNGNGTIDSALQTSHQTGYELIPSSFSQRSDGSVFVGFGFQSTAIQPAMAYDFGRLLSTGALDAGFSLTPAPSNSFLANGFRTSDFARLPDGGYFVFGTNANFQLGYGKVSSSGTEITPFTSNPMAAYFERATALSDGKILVGAGRDSTFTATATLTRLQANGAVDGSFHFSTSVRDQQVLRDFGGGVIFEMSVGSRLLAVQPDGKLLFEYLDHSQFRVVRLNADGSLDSTFTELLFGRSDATEATETIFDPILGQTYSTWVSRAPSFSVPSAQVQPDGRIVLGTRALGTTARGLMRLLPNGTFDNTFNTGPGAQWITTPETTDSVPTVESVVLLPDGKFLIAGTFEAFDGVASPGIALLNPDGSANTSFVAPAMRDKYATGETQLARQADGTILLSGPYHLPGETAAPSFIHILSAPFVSSALIASGTQRQPFSYQITASPTATSFAASGLSAGLTINQTTGLISGTPTVPGTFSVVLSVTNSIGTTSATLRLTIRPAGVANISTRLAVGTGDNVLIGGFIVTGNTAKKVIIRAIGPSLNVNGTPVAGRLLDPIMELHGGSSVVTNDNWRSSQEQEIIASTVPPPDDRESAIVAVLDPGAYTAIVRGKNGATGIALVEVYDLGQPSAQTTGTAQIVNISTRGLVQTGDNVMIGGFIIVGAPTNVIVRAIGPDLTHRGVAGALQDTIIELYDANGQVASNDDWRSTQEQQIVATGVPPNDNRESAIVASLMPGGYTVIVRGKAGATGVGLVEAYSLP